MMLMDVTFCGARGNDTSATTQTVSPISTSDAGLIVIDWPTGKWWVSVRESSLWPRPPSREARHRVMVESAIVARRKDAIARAEISHRHGAAALEDDGGLRREARISGGELGVILGNTGVILGTLLLRIALDRRDRRLDGRLRLEKGLRAHVGCTVTDHGIPATVDAVVGGG
eukprot:7376561-Prymnesium_polylepis.2